MASKETNEQVIARSEVKIALQHLLDICRKYDYAFLGYVFGTSPAILLRFGNVRETGDDFAKLLLQLSDLSNEKQDQGQVLNDSLDEKIN